MNKIFLVLALLGFAFAFLFAPTSEARVGGGRSFGSRGSRPLTPRSPAPHARPDFAKRSSSQTIPPQPSPMGFGGGGFMRSLAGGLAGGLIGSMLFRSLGWAGEPGMGGSGRGIGWFEVLLIAGIGFLVFRWLKNRRGLARPRVTGLPWMKEAPAISPNSFAPNSTSDIPTVLGSDTDSFKDARVDDFFELQAALMNRELAGVQDRMTPQMFSVLETDIAELKNKGQVNRLENITVRESEIVEAWQETDCDYATLRLKANLLDFTIDEKSGAVVSGSQSTPIKFDEFWTFARNRKGFSETWKLSAIGNEA